MAIAQSELLQAGQRRPLMKSQVRAGLQKTAFLCHSHRDSALAEGLQALLAEQGVALCRAAGRVAVVVLRLFVVVGGRSRR